MNALLIALFVLAVVITAAATVVFMRSMENAKPVRYIVRERPPMTEVELRQALLVEHEHPLWLAVHQAIEVEMAHCESALLDVANAGNTGRQSYYAGGKRHLELLQDFLIEQREAAFTLADDGD